METLREKAHRKQIAQNKEKRNYRRRCLQEIKQTIGCIKCGYNEHACALHFDHRDPSTKNFPVTKELLRPWDTLLDEAAKCDVLCANCHAVKTLENGDHLT